MPRRAIEVDVQRHSPLWRGQPGLTIAVRKAARRAIDASGIVLQSGASLAVSLADDAAIRAANRDWREKDKPTNVLSFPAVTPDRLSAAPFVGDVILAQETVAAEAAHDGKSLADHTVHLVVHGVLHLLGYDHMTPADAERMEMLEIRILESLGLPDPYAGAVLMET